MTISRNYWTQYHQSFKWTKITFKYDAISYLFNLAYCSSELTEQYKLLGEKLN